MADQNFPRRHLTMLELMMVGKVAAGIVVALFLIAFAIVCWFVGWP